MIDSNEFHNSAALEKLYSVMAPNTVIVNNSEAWRVCKMSKSTERSIWGVPKVNYDLQLYKVPHWQKCTEEQVVRLTDERDKYKCSYTDVLALKQIQTQTLGACRKTRADVNQLVEEASIFLKTMIDKQRNGLTINPEELEAVLKILEQASSIQNP